MRSAESNPAAPSRVPGSSHDASSGRVHLSDKLMDRLEKLADWRISSPIFEFPEGSPEFHGGYATVSRALLHYSRDSEEGMDEVDNADAVAVKKMKVSGDLTRVLGLTLREAEFLVDLEHENIIELVGFVEDVSKDMIWLVFPWEDNGNLKGFIASADWEIPERISLIDDVAGGVEYLHSRQPPICHGDLKSINILVNSKYRAVITDFGSARRLVANDLKAGGERTEDKLQTALSPEVTFCASTNTITLTGDNYTLRWAAPELLKEEDSGIACDIWALGWVAYEAMTSFIPFQDVKDAVVIRRVVRGDLPSISNDARMLLIQALCSLMIKCWSIDPSKRPTAEDCRKSMRWMPMITPNPGRREDTDGSGRRSPELLMRLGEMHRRQNDYPEARKYFTEALDIYVEIVDRVGEAEALFELARIHRLQGEHNQAIPLYTKALEISTDIGDRDGRARILWNLAEMHRNRGEFDDAITLCTEALQIWTNIDERGGRADALWGLASVHRLRKEYSEAVTFYSEELQIRTEMGDREGRANALWGLAEVHRVRDEYSQAITFYSEALQIRTEIGDRQGRAAALSGLAEVHRIQDEYSEAITLYSEALQIRTEIGDRQGRTNTLWSLAEVHRVQAEYSQAITFFSEALEICAGTGDRYWKAFVLEGLADVYRDQDQHSDAIHHYEQAAETFKEIGQTIHAARTAEKVANVHRLLKEREAA